MYTGSTYLYVGINIWKKILHDLINNCKSSFLEVDCVRVELSFNLIDDFAIPRPSWLTIRKQFFMLVKWNLIWKGKTKQERKAWSNKEKMSLLLKERYTSKGVNVTHCQWKVKVKRKIKGALSGLGQFVETENPLKIMKNAFYFTSKALFILKIFKLLSWFFGHVSKWLDKSNFT